MAATNITFEDKILGQANALPENKKLTFINANEIKSVVNNNATELTTTQGTVATNTTDIAANLSSINTNTTNIATNTSGIAAINNELPTLVPYTGATSDVNLGVNSIKATTVQPIGGLLNEGALSWNDADGTLDLPLKGGNVTLQIGQEEVVRVVNGTGVNLLESQYRAVKVIGAQGQRLQVDFALADSDINSVTTIGVVTESILNNQEGFITTNGIVRGINTTGSLQGETWADGDVLYLSPTIEGALTNIKPTTPAHLIVIGYVVYAHLTQGKIFIKVDNGYELEELHDVLITSVSDNELLQYNSAGGYWENRTLSEAGIQPTGNYIEVGDNVSQLFNDAGYITSAPVDSVAGKTGIVTLVKADITDFSDSDYATSAQGLLADSAIQSGDNVSELVNDSGYITSAPVDSVAGKTGVVTLVKADITDFSDADYATAAQGTTADNSIQKNIGATYTTNALTTLTQAEYDAIDTPDATTIYFIV